jgi:hypothetical protein
MCAHLLRLSYIIVPYPARDVKERWCAEHLRVRLRFVGGRLLVMLSEAKHPGLERGFPPKVSVASRAGARSFADAQSLP